MDATDLIDALVELRMATLRVHPAFREATARPQFRAWYLEGLERIDAGAGQIAVRRAPDGGVQACVGTWDVEKSWHCGAAQVGFVELTAPGDPAQVSFVVEALQRMTLRDELELTVSAAYLEVVDAIIERVARLGVDSIELLGEPRTALQRLIAHRDPPRTVELPGVRLVRLRDPGRAEAMIAMQVAFFAEHPEFCWFFANPGFAEAHLEHQRHDIEQGIYYAFEDTGSGELLGFFGASLEADNAVWGHRAGMDLYLEAPLRGRGLAPTAYRLLLEAMVEREVDVFKGGTSQPAVLELGRIMGRPLLNVFIRPDTTFGRDHFGAFLSAPPAAAPPAGCAGIPPWSGGRVCGPRG